MYDIQFYYNSHDYSDVEVFLATLALLSKTSKTSRIEYARITHYLDLLSLKGTWIGQPFVKAIHSGLWELRPGDNRIFFFCWESDKFILLSVFRKKSQKTPPQEIKLAISRMNDWIRRNKNEN